MLNSIFFSFRHSTSHFCPITTQGGLYSILTYPNSKGAMEHEEIVLDQKRDPRNKGTRHGIKGRGTIKFNRYQAYTERKFTGELEMVSPVKSVKVSLKKRKNWEVSQQSFDGKWNITTCGKIILVVK
jgi:hypothetical protein